MSSKEKYVREAMKALEPTMPAAKRKQLEVQLSSRIEEMLEENPNAGYEELVKVLGKPVEMAYAQVEVSEPEDIQGKLLKRRKVLMYGGLVAGVLVIAMTIYFAVDRVAKERYSEGQYLLETSMTELSLSEQSGIEVVESTVS